MSNIFETLNNPSMLHAALVHFPVALSAIGLLVVLLLTYFNDKMGLRWLAISIYALCVVSGWVAEETGEGAMDMVSNRLSQEIWDLINDHQEMGEKVFIMAGVTLIFLLISLIEHDGVRKIMTLFGLAASFATFALVSFAAHIGGMLVYQHGVGTPMSHVGYEGMNTAPPEGAGDIPIHDIDMEQARQVSFIRDVWPIIDAHCMACHESPEPKGEYAMDTHALMMQAGPKGGQPVVPGKPDESSIVLYIRGVVTPRMPKKKDPLSEEKLHTIRSWIAAGALDDSGEVNDTGIVSPAPESPAFDPIADTSTPEEKPAPTFDPFGGTEAAPESAPEPVVESFDPFGSDSTDSDPPIESEDQGAVIPPVTEEVPPEEAGDSTVQLEENSEQFEPLPAPENVESEGEKEDSGSAESVPAPDPAPAPKPVRPRHNPIFDPFAA